MLRCARPSSYEKAYPPFTTCKRPEGVTSEGGARLGTGWQSPSLQRLPERPFWTVGRPDYSPYSRNAQSRRSGRERPGALHPRRAPTMKQWSLDARSKCSLGHSLKCGIENRKALARATGTSRGASGSTLRLVQYPDRERRVSAHRGWAGENTDFFSVLLSVRRMDTSGQTAPRSRSDSGWEGNSETSRARP